MARKCERARPCGRAQESAAGTPPKRLDLASTRSRELKRIHYILAITATTAILAGGALALPGDSDQIIQGQSAVISGGTASTWARVNGAGKVIWVGLTIPLSMAENMPS